MPNRLFNYLLWFLLITNVLYVTSGALHFPLSHVDVWANWLYKAKALYLYKGNLSFLQDWQGQFAHPHYPIFLPFIFFILYTLAGGVQELLPSLLSSVMYGLTLILCYKTLLKVELTPNQALIFTYLYSMLSPVLAQGGREHAGMPDLYIAVLAWCIFYLTLLSRKEVRYSWTIVLCVILASLIKTEGIFLAIGLFFTGEKRWHIKTLQLFLATSGYWYWRHTQQYLGVTPSYSLRLPPFSQIIPRSISIIAQSIVEFFFNIRNWYIFWWLFLLGLLSTKNWKAYFPFLLFLTVFFVLYFISSIPINGYVTSSLDRLLLQISPFWLVPFAQTFSKYLKGNLFRDHDNLVRVRIWKLLK